MRTQTPDRCGAIGHEVVLRRRGGFGRYFSAAFLGVWLCGWLLGESFALWVLIRGGFALLTGEALNPGDGPIELTAAVAVGTFLLIWLSLWTLGGIAAATQLLRELWGGDRIVAGRDGLVLEWKAGPFRRRRAIPRDEIIGVALLPRRGAIVVDTTRERVEAGSLGDDAERRAVVSALRRELALAEVTRPAAPALPDEWAEVSTPEGWAALAPSPATRALQRRVVAVLASVALGVTAVFVRGTVMNPSRLPLALIGAAITSALAAGALWLARGRYEWRLESGCIVLLRRFDDRVTELFRATRLTLTSREDSDGDEWFELEANSEATANIGEIATVRPDRKQRRRIVQRMNDDAIPRRLGIWIAQRAGIPIDDRTTAQARAAEIAELRTLVEGSGRFGRFVNRLVDRLWKPEGR